MTYPTLEHVERVPGDVVPLPARQAQRFAPPGTSFGHVYLAVRGVLDVSSFERALRRVASQHNILSGQPVIRDGVLQLLIGAADVGFARRTVRDRSRIDAALLADAASEREAAIRRDGGTIRVECVDDGRATRLVVVTFESMVFDAWGFRVFCSHVRAAYEAERASRSLEPVLPTRQIGDYGEWQRQVLDGASCERLHSYWRDVLGGRLEALILAHDEESERTRIVGTRRALPPQLARAAIVDVDFSGEHAQAITDLGKSGHATPYIVFLAAVVRLLAEATSRLDVTVLGPFACRSAPLGAAEIVGNLVNILPIRVAAADVQIPFLELVRMTRTAVLRAIEHEHLPYEHLNEIVTNEALPDHRQVFVGLLESYTTTLGDVQLTSIPQQQHVALYDISFFLGIKERLLRVVYRPVLFDEEWIRRLAEGALELAGSGSVRAGLR